MPSGTSAGERLGVLGGTFDPPHVGHLAVAVDVRHALRLDRVLLVVNNEPWQKVGTRAITPAEDRFAMVEAAVAGLEGLEASRLELDAGGPSFTADTLAALRTEDPGRELFVILGSDAAAGLPTWERVDEVRRAATIVEVLRPGSPPAPTLPGWRWERVDGPGLELSSSELRARLDDGRPLDVLVPAGAVACIEERGLYGRRRTTKEPRP
ncbi:MAG TPA: nicotinate-nucleotide adenylyltransferase [Acidimicrobiales bacterium]|nr:nicotinate-nucleotide adenylyltransferase [Acidimicrobiales bacterium]